MSRNHPKPIPEVTDPYKHIMEKLMPISPETIDGVPHHIRAELTDDDQVHIWVKDRHFPMTLEEAQSLATHLLNVVQHGNSRAYERSQGSNTGIVPPVLQSPPPTPDTASNNEGST